MDGTANNLHVVLKQIIKLMAKRRTTFLNGVPNIVPSTAEPIVNIMQRKGRPPKTDESQATARVAWDAASQDLFSILLFPTGGSAFSVLRRFEGTKNEDGAGDGPQAWTALHEKLKVCAKQFAQRIQK